MSRWVRFCCLCGITGTILPGADIEGVMVIERKLTPRKVTAAASAYTRGIAVALKQETPADPLDFERNHVVVYLEGDSLPSRPVVAFLEQRGRQFEVDLLVVPVGSTVSFPNRDAIFHNVFSLSRARAFDLGNYPKDETRNVRFLAPGLVLVGCHLHPNMGAAIMVTPNRWGVRVEPSGHFRLTGIPPGRYTIVAWHKTAGYFRQAVDLRKEETVPVQFFLPIQDRKAR
jgi:plastocyanin